MRTILVTAASVAAAAGGFLLVRRAGARSFAEALVRAALADVGVREDLGHNDGRRIREFFRSWPVQPPANWCAAATSFWIRKAAGELGIAAPIAGSLQAKAIMDQIQRAGGVAQWHSAEELRRAPALARAGDVVVWDRSDPARPETSWQGHVGVVLRVDPAAGELETVEGNSGPTGDQVARMRRTLRDPRLLGIGRAW